MVRSVSFKWRRSNPARRAACSIASSVGSLSAVEMFAPQLIQWPQGNVESAAGSLPIIPAQGEESPTVPRRTNRTFTSAAIQVRNGAFRIESAHQPFVRSQIALNPGRQRLRLGYTASRV
jgi:hypothetical protein